MFSTEPQKAVMISCECTEPSVASGATVNENRLQKKKPNYMYSNKNEVVQYVNVYMIILYTIASSYYTMQANVLKAAKVCIVYLC